MRITDLQDPEAARGVVLLTSIVTGRRIAVLFTYSEASGDMRRFDHSRVSRARDMERAPAVAIREMDPADTNAPAINPANLSDFLTEAFGPHNGYIGTKKYYGLDERVNHHKPIRIMWSTDQGHQEGLDVVIREETIMEETVVVIDAHIWRSPFELESRSPLPELEGCKVEDIIKFGSSALSRYPLSAQLDAWKQYMLLSKHLYIAEGLHEVKEVSTVLATHAPEQRLQETTSKHE